MKEKLISWKLALSAACAALASVLGWKGILALIWVGCMGLDYLSGTAAAWKAGQWSSAVARAGLWHKAGMILAVTAAGCADLVMALLWENLPMGLTWPGVVLPLVLAWYILTELGSVLENAVSLGAPVPAWLRDRLKSTLKAVEAVGEAGDQEKA